MTTRPTIRARTPVFLGCEGDSEQAYGQFLNEALRERDLPFHIEVVNLNPGAGDPLSRIKRALQEVSRRTTRRSAFRHKTVLMDSDQVAREPAKRRQVEQFAAQCGIAIVWQEPCHEAFLLRHFAGFGNHKPATSSLAFEALKRAWPEYRKPVNKVLLQGKITLEDTIRVAAQNDALTLFLRQIRLIS